MKDFSLSRFVVITVAAVIVLSIIWNFTGKTHTAFITRAIGPVLSDGIHLDAIDNTIQITVRRDVIPVKFQINQSGQNTVIARSDIDVSNPSTREFWFSQLPESTIQSYQYTLEPRVLQSVLITAFALMLGLPRISLKG